MIEDEMMNYEQEGEGLFVRDEANLPPPVRALLEQVKDEKITSVQAWRYPLMKDVQNFVKKFIKLPYDSVYHLGLNLNGKYNLEKDVVIKFTRGGHRGDTNENKTSVYPVTKDITFGELFEQLRIKMGNRLNFYDAETENCQDFSLAILSVLGINDQALKNFIKQDAKAIFKSAGWLEGLFKIGASLSTLKDQIVDRFKYGEGADKEDEDDKMYGEGRGSMYEYNFGMPKCNIAI
jgi:hypothetical protein